MSYEIIGETIKSATSIKLGEIFRTPVIQNGQQVVQNGQPVYNYPIRYKENITNPQYPNFSIVQVNLNVTPQQSLRQSALNKVVKRIQLDYLMNIQYRVVENTESITNLQQQLDAVGLKLLAEFDELPLELPTKVKNCRYEKADGVLQFFFEVTVYANPSVTQEPIMQDMSLDESLGTLVEETEEINEEEEE